MEYLVIKILNEKEIIINYGKEQNAHIGQEIGVYEEYGINIAYNGTNYGNLNKIKGRLKIVEVYKKFSICQKIITETFDPFSFDRKIATTLNVKKTEEKSTYKSYEPIKMGDPVEILD